MSISNASAASAALPSETGIIFAIAQFLKTMLHRVQVARMNQALHQLPQSALEEIGIARNDIPHYAEHLLRRD